MAFAALPLGCFRALDRFNKFQVAVSPAKVPRIFFNLESTFAIRYRLQKWSSRNLAKHQFSGQRWCMRVGRTGFSLSAFYYPHRAQTQTG